MKALETLRTEHAFDLNIVNQIEKEFGDVDHLQEEYNEFWDNGYFE